MKFSEEQITELMQYVTEKRTKEYDILKKKVKSEVERLENSCDSLKEISNFYMFGESMLRIGRVNALYSLLYQAGGLSWDDYMELYDEVYDKFDTDNIKEEIRNQRSLEK